MKGINQNIKNATLLVIIGYRFMLRLLDIVHLGDHFSNYDWSALVLFILIIFIYVKNGFSLVKNSNTYVGLHLLYGSLLGEKIFLGLFFSKALILAEWIWIMVGIFGGFIHYMPNPKKEESKAKGHLQTSENSI